MQNQTLLHSVDELILLAVSVIFEQSYPEYFKDTMMMSITATQIGDIVEGKTIEFELVAKVFKPQWFTGQSVEPVQSYSVMLSIAISPKSFPTSH